MWHSLNCWRYGVNSNVVPVCCHVSVQLPIFFDDWWVPWWWLSNNNEALWREYQNWENYFIAISTIFYTFWCKNDYSTIFLSNVTVCWTSPCMISFKVISQRFGLSKIVICVIWANQACKKKMFHNTSFRPHFHWKKCVSWLCLVWWRFRKII